MPATSLSGGQQKLVALAELSWLADSTLVNEPTEGITPVAQRMGEILASLKKRGVNNNC